MQNKITFITPIHKLSEEEFETYFKRVIVSLEEQHNKNYEYLIIHSDALDTNILNKIKSIAPSNCKYVSKSEDIDYCSMINCAAAYVETPFFSVLEFDDFFINPKWIDVLYSHIDAYPDYSIFLSIIRQANDKDELIGLTNELFWALEDLTSGEEASSSLDSIGKITFNQAIRKQKFDLTGAVIKTEPFIEFGGLKKSINIFFNQELLIRLLHNAEKAFVIPKIGVSHTNFREGSYLHSMKNMNQNEMAFYRGLSRKEYYFIEDRNIKYEEH